MDWREAEASFDDPAIGQTTLGRMFDESASRNRNRIAQRYKGGVYDRSLVSGAVLPKAPDGAYADLSYAAMRDVVRTLAAGFRDLGLAAGDRIALYSHTRMEWAQADFAALAAGAVVTTIYPASSERRVRYVLSDLGVSAAVVENVDLLERTLAATDGDGSSSPGSAADGPGPLDFIVVVDDVDAAAYTDASPTVLTLAAVHERGREAFDAGAYESWLDARTPDDLASVIYTSGTTGRPKGVRLTHRNFRANVNQCYRRFGPRPDRRRPAIGPEATTLSFLPLSHVFERLAGHFLMFAAGATVGYAESPDTLREDLRLVRPTVETSVPRVCEKLYDAVRAQATESAVGERVFEWAVDVGRAYHEADPPGPILSAAYRIADRLVYARVREALGGRIDFLISGGGSLSPDLCALYHAMGVPVIEGYGLTETAPVVSANPVEEPAVGTVGPPLSDVELRIDESVAGGIEPTAGGEVGELLVRGPNVSPGYWERPADTAASFQDGWFRTGDVVELRPDGYVDFRERAKRLLVLSTGKNVAPGPVEDAFAANSIVDRIVVIGDGRKFVSALVVPDVADVRAWADREGIDLADDPAAICRDDRVRARVRREIDRVNETREEHERIKRFRIVSEEFSPANGLLTPTLKERRRNILDRFADEIESMYDGGDRR